MQHESTTYTVTMARSGERQQIRAESWREALERTGRPDACIIDQTGERSYDATFLVNGEPRGVDLRLRYGTDTEAFHATLAQVVHVLDTGTAGKEVQS